MNKQLAICIPTYNRAKVLEELLFDLIPQVAPLDIPIYISDNNSLDQTQIV
ncbi:glycosyltransferase, partial [Sulfuricurvum sp.]|uniref:glycosyltransferase n=1 Tax=Sulfuricurvum sp. TaxID=2025608 RepID=UPI003BB57D66